MKTPKPSDAERPTAQASPMRNCRDSWLSRCDAVRPRLGQRRTRWFPFLFPSPAASTALPTGFPQTPRLVAIENSPSCSWTCAAPPRRPRQHAQERLFSIDPLHLPDRQPGHQVLWFLAAVYLLLATTTDQVRRVKNGRIRRIELDGAQQLHPSVLLRSRR